MELIKEYIIEVNDAVPFLRYTRRMQHTDVAKIQYRIKRLLQFIEAIRKEFFRKYASQETNLNYYKTKKPIVLEPDEFGIASLWYWFENRGRHPDAVNVGKAFIDALVASDKRVLQRDMGVVLGCGFLRTKCKLQIFKIEHFKENGQIKLGDI